MTAQSTNGFSVMRWTFMGLLTAGWIAMLIVTLLLAATLPALIVVPILIVLSIGWFICAIVFAARRSRAAFGAAYTELVVLAFHFVGWFSLGVVYAIVANQIFSTDLYDLTTALVPEYAYQQFEEDGRIATGLAVLCFLLWAFTTAWMGLIFYRAASVEGKTFFQALKTPAHFLMSGEQERPGSMEGKKEFVKLEPINTGHSGHPIV